MLSLKCAHNTFDLSSGLGHVSIRDQIVRAKLLIRDLHGSGLSPRRILVVGAGIAGVCAAVEAALVGIEVVCVDTNPRPFELQHATSHRYVGPYMYEWPANICRPQDFPPKDWPARALPWAAFGTSIGWESAEPLKSSDLADRLTRWLEEWLDTPRPTAHFVSPVFLTKVDKNRIRTWVKKFVSHRGPLPLTLPGNAWPTDDAHTVQDFLPDFVILAAGMGTERTVLEGDVKGLPFWKDDQLKATTTADEQVGVFGAGDGALQDFLRALTRYDHPLQFIDALHADPVVHAAFTSQHEYLMLVEHQNRMMAAWTHDGDYLARLDLRCRHVAETLSRQYAIRRAVAAGLREGTGSVQLYCREKHFTKAYLLNRFLVHLICCSLQNSSDEFAGRMRFSVNFEHTVKHAAESAGMYEIGIENPGKMIICRSFHKISVRHGVNQDTTAVKQMLGLSNAALATRTTLSQLPLPLFYDRI
ncbi:NAD(P)-binding protein [Burkholderia sp. LMG 32019]|uniref:NAD(P)-binding protein n=1 Tax=Burkholderia sp. LMG 32019 TaxID=3158173 RepID=UPI003C306DDD